MGEIRMQDMRADLAKAEVRLKELLTEMKSALVAFSGGVDSALVLAAGFEMLGENIVAFTGVSPTFPPEEQATAREVTARLGIRHIEIDSHELESEGYARNAGDRCYFCKEELFGLAVREADKLGIPWVLDGTITDDLGAHRPGLKAAAEHRVRHPLVEAGFDKAMVRELAKSYGLPVWDKPSFACLGSRFPVGTRVTEDRVGRIQRVESALRLMGFVQLRARWHELDGRPMVRLELDSESLHRATESGLREAIVDVCKAEGFSWVTLDLVGYQSGVLSHAGTDSATA